MADITLNTYPRTPKPATAEANVMQADEVGGMRTFYGVNVAVGGDKTTTLFDTLDEVQAWGDAIAAAVATLEGGEQGGAA